MIQRKTFIITIIAIVIFFLTIIGSLIYYHFYKIEDLKQQKENIMIIPSDEPTGLENLTLE